MSLELSAAGDRPAPGRGGSVAGSQGPEEHAQLGQEAASDATVSHIPGRVRPLPTSGGARGSWQTEAAGTRAPANKGSRTSSGGLLTLENGSTGPVPTPLLQGCDSGPLTWLGLHSISHPGQLANGESAAVPRGLGEVSETLGRDPVTLFQDVWTI